MSQRHRDVTGEWERKHNNTLVGTIRKKKPDFAAGVIRADATLGTLKKKLKLPLDASENEVRKALRK